MAALSPGQPLDSQVAALPETVDTLKAHAKTSLLLLDIRLKSIPLNPLKLATRAAGAKGLTGDNNEDLYYFDPIGLVKAYLSTPAIRDSMYSGLSTFVDSLAEL